MPQLHFVIDGRGSCHNCCGQFVPCAGASVPKTLFLSVSSDASCESALGTLPVVIELTYAAGTWSGSSGGYSATFSVSADTCRWTACVSGPLNCCSGAGEALGYAPFDWSNNSTFISECLSELPFSCGSSRLVFEVSA